MGRTESPASAVGDAEPAAAASTGTMRAILQDRYGSSDVLRIAAIDKPEIATNEVLVKVHAAGVDRGTSHLMRGKPYLMRIIGFGFRGPKQRVPGLDVSGTVVTVGSAVTRFQPGDEVFGIARGRSPSTRRHERTRSSTSRRVLASSRPRSLRSPGSLLSRAYVSSAGSRQDRRS